MILIRHVGQVLRGPFVSNQVHRHCQIVKQTSAQFIGGL